jgi:hypothetical protein
VKRKKSEPIELYDVITSDVPEVGLEPGIIKMVGILNSKGLATYMSCEGHVGGRWKDMAWVEVSPCAFKSYMKARARKMERFLRAGEGLWYLRVEYFAQSCFKGLGLVRPRIKAMKRVVRMDMTVTLVLRAGYKENDPARKVRRMRTMERAAVRYL